MMQSCLPRITYRTVAIALLIFAALLRLLGLNKGIWLDEASTIDLITRPDFLAGLRAYDHPPLYFGLLWGWATLNQSEPFLRLFSVLCSLGMLLVLMQWLKPYGKTASLVAGLLAATMPIMLEYAHELRNYALLLLGTALSFYCASLILRHPRQWRSYIGLTLSLMVVVATHLVGIIVLPALALFLMSHVALNRPLLMKGGTPKPQQPSATLRHYWPLLPSFLLPMLLFLLIFFLFLPQHLQSRSAGSWWMPIATLPQLLLTAQYMAGIPTILGDTTLTVGQFLRSGPGLVLLAGSLLSAAPLLRGHWRQSLPFLAAALTYWLLLWLISIIMAPIFIPRTALPGLIPLLGFIGVQTGTLPTWRWIALPLIGMGLFSLTASVSWATEEAWQPIEQWSPIAETLAAHYQPDDLVIFYPGYNEAATRYYYPPPGLPPPSVVTIWIGGTAEKLGFAAAQIELIKQRNFSSAAFLVLREDQNVANEAHILEQLQGMLATPFGPPQQLIRVGDLLLLKYNRPPTVPSAEGDDRP